MRQVLISLSSAIVFLSAISCAALRPSNPSDTPTSDIASPTLTSAPTATLSPLPTDTPAPTLTPTITLTPTPTPVDYQPMLDALNTHLMYTARRRGYFLGIGFVDIVTGQVLGIDGDTRYHAMSTFKGPLAAFYLWLLERGELIEQPGDRTYLTRMLEISANPDTTCIFERVGGIPPFNDWLAGQGLSRENNFVLKWQDWACSDGTHYYLPELDWRYTQGDEELGLPGGGVLLRCPIPQLPCDKAFAPVELAQFYARLFSGEVLNTEHTALLLSWMEEGWNESVFLNNLPEGTHVRVYVKGGTRQADETYRVNFFAEAGIVETEQGAFALALFMQNNPEWPGTWPMSQVARIVYDHFIAAHTDPD